MHPCLFHCYALSLTPTNNVLMQQGIENREVVCLAEIDEEVIVVLPDWCIELAVKPTLLPK